MPSRFRQDMAPEGGYGPIQWTRQKAGNALSAGKTTAALAFVMTAGYIQAIYMYMKRRNERLEKTEAYIALDPFLKAERERRMLKWQLRLRAEEEDVMKNVPFWEVGKWYNRPIFHNEANRWNAETNAANLYTHCSKFALDRRYGQKYIVYPNHWKNNAKWDRE